MARLKLVIEVDDWSVEQLRRAIRDLDEIASGPGNGITVENVKALDVLTFIINGDLGVKTNVIFEKMED